MIGFKIEIERKKIAKRLLQDKTCENCVIPLSLMYEIINKDKLERELRERGCNLRVNFIKDNKLIMKVPFEGTCSNFTEKNDNNRSS